MKKIFFIPLIFYSLLNADKNYELKLYETILPSIFIEEPIKVYLDKTVYKLLKNSVKFNIVEKCDKSVALLIGENFKNLPIECMEKPIFTTSYRSYLKNKNSFGAFYWRKGRPQIKFKKNVIKKYNLFLPKSLKRYVK